MTWHEIKLIKIFDKMEFKPLIPKLKFTSKKRWLEHLMCKGMREILEEDIRLILT